MELVSIDQYYRMGFASSLSDIGQEQWDSLLKSDPSANPFLSYAFLHALHSSGSASAKTGWHPYYLTIWQDKTLVGACPLYQKTHSYGEYVFDWSWAQAYQQHGLQYYPKLLSAIPFTPVTGSRIIASDNTVRNLLLENLKNLTLSGDFSSCHILFPDENQITQLKNAGFLIRAGVQFHWQNDQHSDFESFLNTLSKKKRKNIRAERKKVQELGIVFSHIQGLDANEEDWLFFKRCYDATYENHHSKPYLNLEFFTQIGNTMPQHVHLIFAIKDGKKIAASLLIFNQSKVYGRYWGCVEHYPCLHFETAYYQAIEFCIKNGIRTFEGGAQGEHKMARGFLPQKTASAHFLTHPEFSNAVANFLQRETNGIELYLDDLNEHNPYKQPLEI
ncbi:GNAT family N-acetyltransferase [Undibacterium aquatile]|uniref:N-acetyltransferase n=1 Tax=Undibacterium aquatile TaxID=1537398 RepID=A0ABR6XJ55_9BURK|nr:GNAT family N-acetyltransferase [Undibacterium aquatile]MBC3812768.1 N-acetyltransferase [Undibacterium aquatile]